VAKKRTKTTGQRTTLSGGRKRVLVVVFVPSVERDGVTTIDQQRWVDDALEMFGRVFGGATAYPKAKGIWRDDERGGALVKDEPVIVHCYIHDACRHRGLSKPGRAWSLLQKDGPRGPSGGGRLGGRRRVLRHSGLQGG
jgi:hypothetical protein